MKTISKRLTDGQDLLVEIKELLKEYNVQAGVILSGVGGLKSSNIRVPVIDGKVTYIHPKNVEIDALHGTLSIHGCHIHITVSGVEGRAWGGHVKEGNIVRNTCEVIVGILEGTVFERTHDESTGYDELEVR